MARHERGFEKATEQRLSVDDLLDLHREAGRAPARPRDKAIARYLAGEEGWIEALRELGGAFAKPGQG